MVRCDHHYQRLQRAGEVVVEDELGDRSLESQVLRLAGTPSVKERPAQGRDLREIPPSELACVLQRIADKEPLAAQDDEALFRLLLDHYGFGRLTRVRSVYLSKVLRAWRAGALSSGTKT